MQLRRMYVHIVAVAVAHLLAGPSESRDCWPPNPVTPRSGKCRYGTFMRRRRAINVRCKWLVNLLISIMLRAHTRATTQSTS